LGLSLNQRDVRGGESGTEPLELMADLQVAAEWA
jgi:hypothetical protein